MQYPAEFHTALITVSSILILVAGVMVRIVVPERAVERLRRKTGLSRGAYINFSLGSMVFGVVSIGLALAWFGVGGSSFTGGAVITLVGQSGMAFGPLWRLMRYFDEPEESKKKDSMRGDRKE